MKYKKQSYHTCLAYALWQVGAVSETAVREYEQLEAFASWETIQLWLDKYVPEFQNLLLVLQATGRFPWGYIKKILGSENLEGKGIVSLYNIRDHISHVISYENGVVLDPGLKEERIDLKKYLELHPEWKVIKILPLEN